MLREVNFFKPDMREDDRILHDECREIEPISPTVHLITPVMTGQVEAVNEFDPPVGDCNLDSRLTQVPRKYDMEELIERTKKNL